MQCIKPSKWQLMPNTCCGFLISWQDVPFLPEPFVGWIPVVSCWLILALKSWLWSGSSITARSSRGKELIGARYQMDELFFARLKTTLKQNWASGSKQAHRRKSMDRKTQREWKWRGFHCIQYKLWGDVFSIFFLLFLLLIWTEVAKWMSWSSG